MTKTFTDDETGKKYELVQDDAVYYGTKVVAIKPIQPVQAEKYQYLLSFDNISHPTDVTGKLDRTIMLTKPQAEAIAAAINELIESVQDNYDSGMRLSIAADKARLLIAGE